jgi:hypothetical protein
MVELIDSTGGARSTIPSVDHLNLAKRINEAHHAGNAALGNALEHYHRAGVLLNEQKAELPHGGWLPWLEANFEGDPRTAQRYMRLADNWKALEANTTPVSYLTHGLKQLTEPKPVSGERAVREQLIPAIRAAKALAKTRDKKLYRETHETFEDYCLERWQMDADGLEKILEIINPESIPLRNAAIGVMLERDLTFKAAIDQIAGEFAAHIAGAQI